MNLTGTKSFYSTIVVTPVGPKCPMRYIFDNIESVEHYVATSFKIVLVMEPNDTRAEEVNKRYPLVDVVYSPRRYPKNGGLYLKVSHAYRYVVENFRFKVLLRMDADALIIGHEPEKEAIAMFEHNPRIAIGGQYPNQYNGKPWEKWWGRKEIFKAITWQLLRRPKGNGAILKLYLKAIRNGYKAGDLVFGGVCFLSEHFLKTLYENAMLPYENLGKCWLEEDHQFSLLAKAYGFEFGDLSSGELPFACDWLGLPASPAELVASRKKLIHSTRFWNHLKEDQIRDFFRSHRTAVTQETQLKTSVL